MNQGFIRKASIALVVGGLVASIYALKKILRPSNQRVAQQELSYEMPRARDEVLPYSLAGRRVVRINPPSAEAASPISSTKAPLATGKAVAAKGPAPAAKKADPKKADTKTAQQKKKPVMTVTVTAGSQSHLKSFENSDSGEGNQAPLAGFTPPPADKGAPTTTQQDDDKVKMSAAQWRSLLFGQPTAKNGNAFLAAFQMGDVDSASFYQISEELLVDSASDRQTLGFTLLKAIPSTKSFTILLNHYQEKTPEPMRTQISTVLQSYASVSRFAILSQLLYSSDAHVVQSAQSLLATAIASRNQHTNGNSGQANNNGRDVRSPGSTATASASQFNTFVPALRRLISSNDPTVAQQAQSLLDSILAMRAA